MGPEGKQPQPHNLPEITISPRSQYKALGRLNTLDFHFAFRDTNLKPVLARDRSGVRPNSLMRKSSAAKLHTHHSKIQRVQQCVAFPEPLGLRRQSKQPFQPAALHPGGSLRQGAADERKCRPNCQHRHRKKIAKLISPDLLAGTADTNKRNFCARNANPECNFAALLLRDPDESAKVRSRRSIDQEI